MLYRFQDRFQGRSDLGTFWSRTRTIFIIQPRNSYDIHEIKPRSISDRSSTWTQMRIIMNTTTFWSILKNKTTFWSISVCPEFQVKVSGYQDTWHKTIGHTPMATRGQETINKSGRLNITCTIAKHQEKQQEHCCEALAIKLIITKIPRSLFKCKSILSYIFKNKLLPSLFFSCLI